MKGKGSERRVETRTFDCWMITYASKEVPGDWVSFSPSFDLYMQGESPEQALSELAKACDFVIFDDLNNGRDPNDRRAPEEDWERLWSIVEGNKKVSGGPLRADAQIEYAMVFQIVARRVAAVQGEFDLLADTMCLESTHMKRRDTPVADAVA